MVDYADGREPVAIEGEIKAVSEKAVLFDDGDTCEWIPRSMIDDLPVPIIEDVVVSITIPLWLAEEKGF